MAYYLTVESGKVDNKEQYQKLDIRKAPIFRRTSPNLKGIGCSLEEIDNFTMQFDGEDELRDYLLTNGILPYSKMDRAITVRQQINGKSKKVMYDMFFKKDKKYIDDVNKLIRRIDDKLWVDEDYRFVNDFVTSYRDYRECSSTAPEVRQAAMESIRCDMMSHLFFEGDENGDMLLTRMVKLLIYVYYQHQNGRVEYSNNIKYRNLHSVLAFVNNYDKKYKESKEKSTGKIRKLSRPTKVLEGQIDIFGNE